MPEFKDKDRIWLSAPHMSGMELSYVREAFELNWISPAGPHLAQFEQSLQEYTGVGHAVALSSGTAAIHLALISLGIGQGDLVICQSFTFAGSAFPIIYQGAEPVFIDSENETWNMDPNLLEDAIKKLHGKPKKIKAIIPVHLYGMPAKMSEITEVASKYGIPIIEDAAEALGSSLGVRKCGSMGDISVLSFNGNKIITTSGGGAILTENQNWAEKIKFLSTQARDPALHYEHSAIGYNYRLSNVSAAIGLGQMEVVDSRVDRRRQVYQYYLRELGHLLDFGPEETASVRSNRWLSTALINNEGSVQVAEIISRLEKENIESRPLWKPMHMQPVFKNAWFLGNGLSERLFAKGICLPSGSALGDQDLEKICTIINGIS